MRIKEENGVYIVEDSTSKPYTTRGEVHNTNDWRTERDKDL